MSVTCSLEDFVLKEIFNYQDIPFRYMIESARYSLHSQLLRKQVPGHYRIAGTFDYHHHMLQNRVPNLSTQSTYRQLCM